MPAPQGSITFVNKSAFDASIFRESTFVTDLAPAGSSTQNTAQGEVWNIKDKATGRFVGTVTGTSEDQTYEIKFKRGRGEPVQGGSGGN